MLFFFFFFFFTRHRSLPPSASIALSVSGRPSFDAPPSNAKFESADGILVPGGFGNQGIEGKILAAKHARKNRVLYLGICQGMQISVIEFARSVVGVRDANNTEFDTQTTTPYVIFMPEFSSHETMRLGSRRTYFHDSGCKSAMLYGNASFVDERHGHGYEVNPEVVKQLEDAGMAFVGKDETGQRMELTNNLASQPEFLYLVLYI